MRLNLIFAAPLVLLSAAAAHNGSDPSAAEIRRLEDVWSDAFISGDLKRLDTLLASDYISVSQKGQPRTKCEVMQMAANYASSHSGQHGRALASNALIEIVGGTALVRHTSESERSIDLFKRENGRWVAWYSQHTAVAAATP